MHPSPNLEAIGYLLATCNSGAVETLREPDTSPVDASNAVLQIQERWMQCNHPPAGDSPISKALYNSSERSENVYVLSLAS
jgi:hypothetical protein